MFKLEKAITEWRQSLRKAGINSPAALDELEGHLREIIDLQLQKSAGEELAFLRAARQMGRAEILKREFEKTSGADKGRQRKLVGFILAGILVFYSLTAAVALIKNDLTFGERTLGLASVAAMLAVNYFLWQIAPRYFPSINSRATESALGIFGGVSGMAWIFGFVYLILPRFDFTASQLPVVFLWAMIPMITLPTVGFAVIDKNENQRAAVANP